MLQFKESDYSDFYIANDISWYKKQMTKRSAKIYYRRPNICLNIQSVQKETQTFLLTFRGKGVKIIYCNNDIMSVALPFNKELCSKVLLYNGLQALGLG